MLLHIFIHVLIFTNQREQTFWIVDFIIISYEFFKAQQKLARIIRNSLLFLFEINMELFCTVKALSYGVEETCVTQVY